MKIHTIQFWESSYASPQQCCNACMKEKRPFIMGLNFKVRVGDLLLFPAFFVSYPVIRMTTPTEEAEYNARYSQTPYNKYTVVCKEPPQENEATEEVPEGLTLGVSNASRKSI